MNKKKKILLVIIIVIIIVVVVVSLIILKPFKYRATNLPTANGITVVPTMNDSIKADSSWCGTFQLVWNDMKNELVKKDIVFNPQLDMVRNLNKEDFNESMLSQEYYYKTYGFNTFALKNKIETAIKEKFNQQSDVLKFINWGENGRNYVFYTMLYRQFEFLQTFDKLDNGKFGDKYKDVKYFGIDKNTEAYVKNQIEVLYYNSKDDFAILINTKTNDEVIFVKNPKGSTFNEIYKNMKNETKKYTGKSVLNDRDEFKAPTLKIDKKREYNELENKLFETNNPSYNPVTIAKAIQTIKLTLDEKGGKIKSEAVITTKNAVSQEDKPRYFYLNDTFAIFLREKGKTKPYFAGRIKDVTKFQ